MSDRFKAEAKNSTTSGNPHHPMLSVVVPVFNSSQELSQCLAALDESDFEDFEVIVANDGSTESIEQIVAQHQFRYLKLEGKKGPARARNRGAEVAHGIYVVFIDADVCVHKDTLRRFAYAFADSPDVAAVLGSYDDSPAHTNFMSQHKNLFHHYVHQAGHGEAGTFWSGCGAMRRDLFLAFGGFDEERYRRPAIEDIELGTWMRAAGYRLILDRNIQAKHLKRWTFWGVVKTDILDRGIPWVRLMWRAGSSANLLNAVPSQRLSLALVYLTGLSLVATVLWPMAGIIAALSFFGVTLLNADLYHDFMNQRGVWFTLRALPLHWLYFFYCGVALGVGTLLYFIADRGQRAAPMPPVPRNN